MSAHKKHSVKKILGAKKRRITANRELLLAIIHESKGHFDADEIYRKARQRNSTISLSTVYRNIQLFKKLGLIEERHFSDDHHHYEKKKSLDHEHFQCNVCGKIIEFTWPMLESVKKTLCERHRFEIEAVEIELKGICSECLDKRENNR